jgi:hypothetical protein
MTGCRPGESRDDRNFISDNAFVPAYGIRLVRAPPETYYFRG